MPSTLACSSVSDPTNMDPSDLINEGHGTNANPDFLNPAPIASIPVNVFIEDSMLSRMIIIKDGEKIIVQ